MNKKQRLSLVLSISLFLVCLTACNSSDSAKNSSNSNNPYVANYSQEEMNEKYPGYYVEFDAEEAMVSITNYDPYGSTYPEVQELVQYGYCGIRSSDLIYFVYVMDDDNYCYLEISAETLEIIHEDNSMYTDAERDAKVNELIGIMDYIIKVE